SGGKGGKRGLGGGEDLVLTGARRHLPAVGPERQAVAEQPRRDNACDPGSRDLAAITVGRRVDHAGDRGEPARSRIALAAHQPGKGVAVDIDLYRLTLSVVRRRDERGLVEAVYGSRGFLFQVGVGRRTRPLAAP